VQGSGSESDTKALRVLVSIGLTFKSLQSSPLGDQPQNQSGGNVIYRERLLFLVGKWRNFMKLLSSPSGALPEKVHMKICDGDVGTRSRRPIRKPGR
jgi:hypothetical protein